MLFTEMGMGMAKRRQQQQLLLLVALLLASFMIVASSRKPPCHGPMTAFSLADFTDENIVISKFTLVGDAQRLDSGILQISGSQPQTAGSFFLSRPVRFSARGQPMSFSTFFSFSMDANKGDGLAFVIAPKEAFLGSAVGPWLGLSSGQFPHGLAIEFDTSMNPEVQDPSENHVGIDIESLVSVTTADISDEFNGDRLFAWIDYRAPIKTLEVRLSRSQDARPETPILSYEIDLSNIWTDEMFVGFSSSTGVSPQKHVIYSWSFITIADGMLRKQHGPGGFFGGRDWHHGPRDWHHGPRVFLGPRDWQPIAVTEVTEVEAVPQTAERVNEHMEDWQPGHHDDWSGPKVVPQTAELVNEHMEDWQPGHQDDWHPHHHDDWHPHHHDDWHPHHHDDWHPDHHHGRPDDWHPHHHHHDHHDRPDDWHPHPHDHDNDSWFGDVDDVWEVVFSLLFGAACGTAVAGFAVLVWSLVKKCYMKEDPSEGEAGLIHGYQRLLHPSWLEGASFFKQEANGYEKLPSAEQPQGKVEESC